jgi:hypothetical protein
MLHTPDPGCPSTTKCKPPCPSSPRPQSHSLPTRAHTPTCHLEQIVQHKAAPLACYVFSTKVATRTPTFHAQRAACDVPSLSLRAAYTRSSDAVQLPPPPKNTPPLPLPPNTHCDTHSPCHLSGHKQTLTSRFVCDDATPSNLRILPVVSKGQLMMCQRCFASCTYESLAVHKPAVPPRSVQ